MSDIKKNPFDFLKATDFSDEEIYNYWVDLVGDVKLQDFLKPTSTMSMMLLGGKGSGKTHLMRFFSSAVQRLRFGGSLSEAVLEEGYLGIYVRADALNVNRFTGKGHDEEEWEAVFSYYFELRLAINLLKSVSVCIIDFGPEKTDTSYFLKNFKDLFSSKISESFDSILSAIDFLGDLRKQADRIIANVATRRTSLKEVNILFAPGDLIFSLPIIIRESCSVFLESRFVYMIDELENFSEYQQMFVNSLIRYRRGPVSFKVGSRLYGIKTLDTSKNGEPIKKDAEFEEIVLEDEMRSTNKIPYLFDELVKKRLLKAGWISNVEDVDIESFFEQPETDADLDNFIVSLFSESKNKGREKGHVSRFSKKIDVLLRAQIIDDHGKNEILSLFSFPDRPLIEKICYLSFYKEWRQSKHPIRLAKAISLNAKRIIDGPKKPNASFQNRYSQFKSDLVSQLIRESTGKRAIYYGFKDMVEISQGVPRNLLSILKSVFRKASFNEEKPFQPNQKISIQSQSEGILDASEWFWSDAQPDVHGAEVRTAVDGIASYMSDIRFSANPPECGLSTLMVKKNFFETLTLKHALNWSYLLEIRHGGIDKNKSNKVNRKFQISPMLAPRFGLSTARRGVIEVSPEVFSGLLLGSQDIRLELKNKVDSYDNPFSINGGDHNDLFGGEI